MMLCRTVDVRAFVLVGAAAALALGGCVGAPLAGGASRTPPPAGANSSPMEPREVGILFAPSPVSLDAARAAHRYAELRRHLRFLEAKQPGSFLRQTAEVLEERWIQNGRVGPTTLRYIGRLLFEHEFGFVDGLGSAEARQRLDEGKSPFRRVHRGRFGGPETTSCASCHWRGGTAGAGALQDNSFLFGDGVRVSSADARNPPPLQGVGVVQALAEEMSAALQALRAGAIERATRGRATVEIELNTHGVSFGALRVSAAGVVDPSGITGVDPDLVIKPFGWKGTFASLGEFVDESLQVHFGIQSESLLARHAEDPDPELVVPGGRVGTAGRQESDPDGASAAGDVPGQDPGLDPDGDGVAAELTFGQHAALVAFLALQEVPVVRPPETLYEFAPVAKNLPAPTESVFLDEWARGRQAFDGLGCASCHTPRIVLKNPILRLPLEAGGFLELDLSRHAQSPRIEYDEQLGGYPVWLFSDLKRHDMGARSAAQHLDHGVARSEYLTRRLWGLASSPPYFYDGEAASFDEAISAHGGEGAEAAAAYREASADDRAALRVYLLSLTRERRLVVPR